MIALTLFESTSEIISGIPEYLEFKADTPSNIFYTLDGTDPTIESLIALGKVYLPTSGLALTVKAVAISADDSSSVLTQHYSSNATRLDGPRNIGEGISVLPYGSNSINNLSYDAYGEAAQESSTEFVDLDIKASLDGNSKKTLLSFVNFASTEKGDDRFSSSTVNENVYFDPNAKLILIDGTSQEKLDNQSVKLINRTYNSFDPTSDFYKERLGQKEPLITGNYVKSFYNPATNEYVSFYYESLDSRWIVSKQKLKNVEKRGSLSYSAGNRFVYQWIENRGPATPASMIGSLVSRKKTISSGPKELPRNWIIVAEYPEGTILFNGSPDFPTLTAGEEYRFLVDDPSLEEHDLIGFTLDGATEFLDGVNYFGIPGEIGAYFTWDIPQDVTQPPYGSHIYYYIGDPSNVIEQLSIVGSTYSVAPFDLVINSVLEGDESLTIDVFVTDDGGSEVIDFEYTIDGGLTWTALGSANVPVVIESLTNGVLYTLNLRAVNIRGGGRASSDIIARPSRIPFSPIINSITEQDQQLIVDFTLGGDGGLPVLDVEFSLDNGASWSSTGAISSPYTIVGLINGTVYPIVIRSINENGSGDISNTYLARPSTVPDSPTLNSIIEGNEQLTLSFTVSGDGGVPISDIEYSLDAGLTWISAGVTSGPYSILGLANGVGYTVAIRALNSNGPSISSNQIFAIPSTIPVAPIINSITAGDEEVLVSFSSSGDGGSPILDYEYTIDGEASWNSLGTLASPATIGGLTNGLLYSFKIRAVNINGPSLSSNEVFETPSGLIPTFAFASFDGVDETIESAKSDLNLNDMIFSNTDPWSISLWIRAFDAQIAGLNTAEIFGLTTDDQYNVIHLLLQASELNETASIQGSWRVSGEATLYGFFNVDNFISFPHGKWTNIIWTYDGSGTQAGFRWFIDGEEKFPNRYAGNPGVATSGFVPEYAAIGGSLRAIYSEFYPKADMTSVAVFNSSLTGSDIANLSSAVTYDATEIASCIHFWDFAQPDDNLGDIAGQVSDAQGSLTLYPVNMEVDDLKLTVELSAALYIEDNFVYNFVDDYDTHNLVEPIYTLAEKYLWLRIENTGVGNLELTGISLIDSENISSFNVVDDTAILSGADVHLVRLELVGNTDGPFSITIEASFSRNGVALFGYRMTITGVSEEFSITPSNTTASAALDGVDEYFSATIPSLSFGGDDPWTYSTWIKISSGASGASGQLMSFGGQTLYLLHLNGEIILRWRDLYSNDNYTVPFSSYGVWSHIVVSYDGLRNNADSMKFYVNNNETISPNDYGKNLSNIPTYENNVFELFKRGPYITAGKVSQTAWFNRALSPDEVARLYNSGSGSDPMELAPIVAWDFKATDDLTSLTGFVEDSTGAYNLTPVNTESSDLDIIDYPS